MGRARRPRRSLRQHAEASAPAYRAAAFDGVRRQRGYHIRAERCRLRLEIPLTQLGWVGQETLEGHLPDEFAEGRGVLLVEDESLVAMLAEDMLLDLGCGSWWPCASTRPWIMSAPGSSTWPCWTSTWATPAAIGSRPAVRALHAVPVRDLYGTQGLEEAYRSAPVLQKPYQAAAAGASANTAPHLRSADVGPRRRESRGVRLPPAEKGNPPERSFPGRPCPLTTHASHFDRHRGIPKADVR